MVGVVNGKCILGLLAIVAALYAQDDSMRAMRAAMESSIAKQRESVRRQVQPVPAATPPARATTLANDAAPAPEEDTGWYTAPWPRPAEWIGSIDPIPLPAMPMPPPPASIVQPRAAAGFPCSPISPVTLSPIIHEAADRQGYTPELLRAVIQKESAYYPCAVSNKGAMGLMQLMPATAASLGVTDPMDPADNLAGGARFLGQLLARYGGNLSLALAAYNAGPGKVDAYGGVPPYPETQNYVREVMKNAGTSQ
jgi:soluble lytic murein transglycosylase-like protein